MKGFSLQNQSNTMDRDVLVRVLGIHLAGASTRRSAVARAVFGIRRILSGIPAGIEHELFASAMQQAFPALPVYAASGIQAAMTPTDGSTPLLFEAYTADLGPSPKVDADSRFVEAIQDLGGADIFVLDAPLTLPPCTECRLACPGTPQCPVFSVEQMRREWGQRQKVDKRMRLPQPYVDRFFELYARNTFENAGFGSAFEAVLGSGRAPLAARAMRLAREIRSMYPSALILETNAIASAIGWARHVEYRLTRGSSLRTGPDARAQRAGLWKRLEAQRIVARSAALHSDLYAEICAQPELFFAAMGALSAWGLLNGEILVTKEFLTIEPRAPLQGWACVPKGIAHFAWAERAHPGE